jgi:CRP-like cAMP-binding protein
MRKTIALSGAAQDAYFRRLLKAHPGLGAEDRDRVLQRLRREIAQLQLRREPPRQDASAPTLSTKAARASEAPALGTRADVSPRSDPLTAAAAAPFDPFSPNIVVLVRTSGSAAALAALAGIDSEKELRLLAHEQRLSVRPDLSSLTELRAAIVAAAERRIANRLAAAR